VCIRREHHPLCGRSLAVYGWTHRHGRLELILVLPDGSKSMVPADWTDLVEEINPGSNAEVFGDLASISQLLRVRVVVDSLLARQREQQQREAQDSAT